MWLVLVAGEAHREGDREGEVSLDLTEGGGVVPRNQERREDKGDWRAASVLDCL